MFHHSWSHGTEIVESLYTSYEQRADINKRQEVLGSMDARSQETTHQKLVITTVVLVGLSMS
jgi:hypothetical protein